MTTATELSEFTPAQQQQIKDYINYRVGTPVTVSVGNTTPLVESNPTTFDKTNAILSFNPESGYHLSYPPLQTPTPHELDKKNLATLKCLESCNSLSPYFEDKLREEIERLEKAIEQDANTI